MTTAVDLKLSNQDYHAESTSVSNTAKETFRKSQAMYYGMYVARTIPFLAPTPALVMGSAVHTAVLEPDLFATDYVYAPKCDRRTTVGKVLYQEFLDASEGKTVLSIDEYELVRNMQTACRRNELVRNLLDMPGDVEHSYKWQDEATGMWLKSRPDKTFDGSHDGQDIIFDLKTCPDASPQGFEFSCRSHGYHRTAAFRIDGHLARTGNKARYLFAAVSKETLEVGLYVLQPEEIELGRKENRSLLKRMARCYETDDWEPVWSKRINSLSYPAWMFNDQWEVEDDN